MLGKVVGVTKRVGKAYVWSITGDLKEVRENAQRLRDRIHGLMHRKYAQESFEDAVERFGISAQDLKKRHDMLSALSLLYGAIFIVALISLGASFFSPHPVNHALMSVGVMLIAGTKFLAARFRLDQIRQRKLFSFKGWFYQMIGASR